MNFIALASTATAVSLALTASAGELDERWWEQLNDPVLTGLIEEGLAANYNLAAARERALQSDALAIQTRSALLPSLSVEVKANTSPYEPQPWQTAIPGVTPSNADVIHTGSAMLVAAIQIDIFGKTYKATQAAYLEAHASENDRDALAVTTTAMVARSYYDVVLARARLTIVKQQVEAAKNLLSLVEARLAGGSANALDVLQQRQQLQSIKANIPLAALAVELAQRQLNVLVGRSPDTVLPSIADEFPEAPKVEVDHEGDLTKRRPDLRAAQQRVDAAHSRSSSAFRGMLPTLKFSAQVGYEATYVDSFESDDTWLLSAVLSIPLFDGLSSYGAWKQAEAAEGIARRAFLQAKLQSEQELANAIARKRAEREHLEAIRAQAVAARQTLDEARNRYLSGSSAYVNVLSAQNGHYAAELSVLSSKRDHIDSLIALYQAVGGAYTERLGTNVKE